MKRFDLQPRAATPLRRLARASSGVAYGEYVILTVVVGLLVAGALVAVGVPLLASFRRTQLLLGAPVP
ncbi:MAG TPA: hypothetical protein RMH85_01820 [Polyangiaceae bacterium LLY-WYZ-15_(1-7)]|nr:hypothetical protein [Myxococcales bacterium]MAT25653.1 hypothetical protein [Sandaracinus sp.]HJL00223.1 hypothetical protein [Polyangiaceae bacterium LLY-WYZ-15_(1-7)]MBJ74286.1 hypothetical protein [Sandaracinus sp.]HJL07202.1 hypothetical protein [Polyangiaceae bacterium LLY-WYZ-15_(1-7)]